MKARVHICHGASEYIDAEVRAVFNDPKASAIPSDELLANIRADLEATLRGDRQPTPYLLERAMFLVEWLEAERRENALPIPETDPGRLLVVANLLRSLASGDVTDARWYWREMRLSAPENAEQCRIRAEAFLARARLELEAARALERFVDTAAGDAADRFSRS